MDQNEPNPFDETTVVGFVLPAAGNASLTVFNVSGKVITAVNSEFAQGYNEIKFIKRELNTTGVLYYTLQSGDFTSTKKMIVLNYENWK